MPFLLPYWLLRGICFVLQEVNGYKCFVYTCHAPVNFYLTNFRYKGKVCLLRNFKENLISCHTNMKFIVKHLSHIITLYFLTNFYFVSHVDYVTCIDICKVGWNWFLNLFLSHKKNKKFYVFYAFLTQAIILRKVVRWTKL